MRGIGGVRMKGNQIKNSNWYERENEQPRYFKTNEYLHFDETVIESHKVASLSFHTEEYERLVYTETIACDEAKKVTVGLVIRGNDLEEINYKVAFYNEADVCVDVYSHNVVAEVTPQFKRVCVTYPVPNGACYLKVGWEFKGINTGITLFNPSVQLMD